MHGDLYYHAARGHQDELRRAAERERLAKTTPAELPEGFVAQLRRRRRAADELRPPKPADAKAC
jgi:hypothetical protein